MYLLHWKWNIYWGKRINCSKLFLAPANHNFENSTLLIQNKGFKKSIGGIHIGSDVWIGQLIAVLDGSDIGNGCVFGSRGVGGI